MRGVNSCTWEGCTEDATQPQLDKNGRAWVDLCYRHHEVLGTAIDSGVPQMLSAWVKAKGGAKKAAEAM